MREGLNRLNSEMSGNRPAVPTSLNQTEELSDAAPELKEDLGDQARASRQMVRWLVADVPRRLDVIAKEDPSLGVGSMRLQATVRAPDFTVMENADVKIQVTDPEGRVIELSGEPAEDQPECLKRLWQAQCPVHGRLRFRFNLKD